MGGPTGSIGAGGGSALNNLSALTPMLNALMQAQQDSQIQSGQGNMQAQPAAQAIPGASSGSMQIASAGGVPGIAPVAGGGLATGGADVAGGPGGAPGAASDAGTAGVAGIASDTSPGDTSTAGDTGTAGPTGDVATGLAAGETTGDTGTSGGAGDGGAGGGGTILVTYALRHIPDNARRAMAFWTRLRRMVLETDGGPTTYVLYQKYGAKIIAAIEALPDALRDRYRRQIHTILVAPCYSAAHRGDVERSIRHLTLTVAGLLYSLGMEA
jgi:hypothetical protein